MKKKLALGVVVLLAVPGAAAWFIDFDASRIGDELLRHTRAATGLDFHVSRSRINLVRGIRLEDVVATESFPTGRYSVAIESMRFEHRLLPLLRRELDFERVVLERPEVEVLYGLSLETEEPSEQSGSGGRRRRRSEPQRETEPEPPPFTLSIDELVLRDGTVRVLDVRRDNEGVRLDGLHFTLREPTLARGALTLIHGARASGVLGVNELYLRGTVLNDVEAEIKTASGKMDLIGSFQTGHGAFDGTANLDFTSLPFRHRIEMNARLRDAEMSIALEGFGLNAKNLKGEGRLQLASEADEIPVRVENGRIVLEGEGVAGSIDLDGRLELERTDSNDP